MIDKFYGYAADFFNAVAKGINQITDSSAPNNPSESSTDTVKRILDGQLEGRNAYPPFPPEKIMLPYMEKQMEQVGNEMHLITPMICHCLAGLSYFIWALFNKKVLHIISQ